MLITVDCLHADHCGFYGYPRATTPFLDSLTSESFVVPTAIVAGAPTYYSLPAILASRMPLALGRDLVGLAPDRARLPLCCTNLDMPQARSLRRILIFRRGSVTTRDSRSFVNFVDEFLNSEAQSSDDRIRGHRAEILFEAGLIGQYKTSPPRSDSADFTTICTFDIA